MDLAQSPLITRLETRPQRRPATPACAVPPAACRACPDRQSCTGDASGEGRHPALLPQPSQEIQTRNRTDQYTDEWKARYALRASCEAIVSGTTRAHGLRECRYRGLAKVHVRHVLAMAGTNVLRLAGHYTRAPTSTDQPVLAREIETRKADRT
ncbi:transposase [Nonomuraea angiospora]|uniref:transposase n=1 Tax=Nonomuraea angiospora TaxID=46172 RepID=UPI0034028B04